MFPIGHASPVTTLQQSIIWYVQRALDKEKHYKTVTGIGYDI